MRRASRAACLAGRAVVPQTDGVESAESGWSRSNIIEGRPWTIMQESTCLWNTRAFVLWTRLATSFARTNRQRTRGAHRLVRFIGLCADPDRPGGWSALAMALRGDEESWAGGRAFRNAARARCLQGDAGQVRSQRRARDSEADAAWLVSAGALQVDWGPGDSRRTDCTQAGRIEASRHRE